MFKVTQRAATQILTSAQQNNLTGLALRLAPQRNPDGSIEYNKMGFDQINAGDVHLICEGIDIVFEPIYKELLNGAIMDFVEIEPGQFSFIFLNPNDPNYLPPTEN
ncbi:protein involved in sulfur oxidation DsrR [Thioploca ingrica]|uniref:Protein involved in sulfur oxidation DsrR n=1 Tax=Thioploca ingrica TaxID=40754 RepID=A0A090AQW5_9GAMM|nr:protein involved in sulfur oxidation DsrR [Thioploca ingrica]